MDARADSAGYLYLVPFRYCPSGKTHRPECGELVFLRLLAEIRLGATVIVYLERVHDFIGPLVERQIGFRVIYIAQLRVRLGRARHKQRAAVGRILATLEGLHRVLPMVTSGRPENATISPAVMLSHG
mgnify:CR=1 FL=1